MEPEIIRSDLQVLLEGEGTETGFSPDESRMLKNILSLRERRVDDVMVPRTDIVASSRMSPSAISSKSSRTPLIRASSSTTTPSMIRSGWCTSAT